MDTAYWDQITSERAFAQFKDEKTALAGNELISAEAQFGMQEEDILAYITEHFADFLRYVRALSLQDQELLLSYYCLGKTQTDLAHFMHTSQTMCSSGIRLAVRALLATMVFGAVPTADALEPVLARAGMLKVDFEGVTADMSEVLEEYQRCRSFFDIAVKYGMRRPAIRRTIKRVSLLLREETREPKEQALGWWMFRLMERANPRGRGENPRQQWKSRDMDARVPGVCGKFDIDIEAKNFDLLFAAHANL